MTDPQPVTTHSNQWNVLASQPRPFKVVDFPRYDAAGKPYVRVGLRTFGHETNIKIQTLAQTETDRIFRDEGRSLETFRTSQIYEDRYKNIAAKHYLMEACRDPENPNLPFFPTPDAIAKECTLDEVTVLVKWHKQFDMEYGPTIGHMTPAEQEALIERLVAAGRDGAYFLGRIVPEAQSELLTYMASQLWSYRTGKSSPGSQPDESTTSAPVDRPSHDPQPIP